MSARAKGLGHRGPSSRAAVAFIAFLLASSVSFAQTPAASAASSPAKRDLAQRFLVLQQPSVENLVRNLVEAPARQLMAAGDPVLQTRVAPDKREAAVKQVQEDVRKYVDSALPVVRDRAAKLSQSVLLPAIEEKFTEDELRQIVTFLESPVQRKLQQTLPDLSQVLAGHLVADTRPQIDPKLKTLEAAMAKTLGVQLAKPSGAASGSGASGGSGASPMPAGSGLGLTGARSTPLGKSDKAASKP